MLFYCKDEYFSPNHGAVQTESFLKQNRRSIGQQVV